MDKVGIWWCFALIVLYFPMLISFFAIGFYDRTPLHILEDGDITDGDMILTEDQVDSLRRTGKIDEKYRWPNNTVVFDFDTKCNDLAILLILDAINYINKELRGCIYFERRWKRDKRVYVLIKCPQGRKGCFANVGYNSKIKATGITLSERCLKRGTIVHECFHALGLHHMMCAPTRDKYVTIHYENIKEKHIGNFRKYSSNETSLFDLPYDYLSIMHYGAYAFSKNGKKTIVPKYRLAIIGIRYRVSELDFERIRRMYKCKKL